MHESIYENSMTSSGMRRLLVDIAIRGWPKGTLKDAVRGEAWEEFFFDVAMRLHPLRGPFRSAALSLNSAECLYYDHGSGKPCSKTMFDWPLRLQQRACGDAGLCFLS